MFNDYDNMKDEYYSPFNNLKKQIDGIFDSLNLKDECAEKIRTDLYETDDNYIVLCELPGITKEDLSLQIIQNELLIQGNKEIFHDIDFKKPLKKEIHFGTINKNIKLPSRVDSNNIKAQLINGILIIHIGKKKDENTPVKNINID